MSAPETTITKSMNPLKGDVMTNADHSIDDVMAKMLKNTPSKVYADYPGRDFHARVWYVDKLYHAEIWVYHDIKEIMARKTLRGLMNIVSNKYGWE